MHGLDLALGEVLTIEVVLDDGDRLARSLRSKLFVETPVVVKLFDCCLVIYWLLSIRLRYKVKMDDPNITMEEYIRLEEENARRRAIVFNDALTSEVTLPCEPTVSPLNDNEIDFRISFDESNDEDYTVIYEENSFSYKIISVNNLKTDSENDNKVNMPSFPSPEPTASYFDDLDFFKDFENEFLAIVYNDGITSKPDLEIKPPVSSEHVCKSETSLSEYDEEEQNVLHFSNSFPLDEIFPNDPKMIKDSDDDTDIAQPYKCNKVNRSN
ncbi:hypothetical protein Tco_0799499 [Tanacetum coccineum]|uniref:Reverse transcriptase domain-containing protein n=1 Tax=Tanacetum coccineum TaxID=301880 RepID=A0ABQ4ZST0_9ASTR